MTRPRLASVGYAMALFMLVVPFVDTYLLVGPLNPGDLTWRYESVGLLSRAMELPFLGLLLAGTLASILNQRLVLRGMSVIAFLGALVFAGLAVVFVLDALQLRTQVIERLARPWDRAWMVGSIKFGIGVLILGGFGLGAWMAGRPSTDRTSERKDGPDTLIMGARRKADSGGA